MLANQLEAKDALEGVPDAEDAMTSLATGLLLPQQINLNARFLVKSFFVGFFPLSPLRSAHL